MTPRTELREDTEDLFYSHLQPVRLHKNGHHALTAVGTSSCPPIGLFTISFDNVLQNSHERLEDLISRPSIAFRVRYVDLVYAGRTSRAILRQLVLLPALRTFDSARWPLEESDVDDALGGECEPLSIARLGVLVGEDHPANDGLQLWEDRLRRSLHPQSLGDPRPPSRATSG